MTKKGTLDEVTVGYLSGSSTNRTNGGQTVLNVRLRMSSDVIRGGDTFYFTLPSQLNINPVGTSFTCKPVTRATCTRSGNAIAAKFVGSTSLSLGNQLDFQIEGVINPSNTRTTSPVTDIYLKDSENYFVAEALSTTPGSRTITTTEAAFIQRSSLYQDNLSLGVGATYRIEFIT
jgi:hypothetical protein